MVAFLRWLGPTWTAWLPISPPSGKGTHWGGKGDWADCSSGCGSARSPGVICSSLLNAPSPSTEAWPQEACPRPKAAALPGPTRPGPQIPMKRPARCKSGGRLQASGRTPRPRPKRTALIHGRRPRPGTHAVIDSRLNVLSICVLLSLAAPVAATRSALWAQRGRPRAAKLSSDVRCTEVSTFEPNRRRISSAAPSPGMRWVSDLCPPASYAFYRLI